MTHCAIVAPKPREEDMAKAYFVVRATIADPTERKAFDKWYQTEHLPDATKSFGAIRAWRLWGSTDPSMHQATCEFADEASLDRAMKGDDLKRLVADFNRDWPDVKRTRESFVLAQDFGVGSCRHSGAREARARNPYARRAWTLVHSRYRENERASFCFSR